MSDLVSAFQPLARRLARRYSTGAGIDADLLQVANLGLVLAARRYNPELGAFPAFALSTVSGELKKHLRDRGWLVHVPRAIQEHTLEVDSASVVLEQRLGRTPTVSQVAAETGLEAEVVRVALQAREARFSCPMPATDPSAYTDDLDERTMVRQAMTRLSRKEADVIYMIHFEELTQREAASRLGISQTSVRRRLASAYRHLEKNLGEGDYETAREWRDRDRAVQQPSEGVLPAAQTTTEDRMNDEQVTELLYQALETELGGVEVYKTALKCAVNEDLHKEWEKYLSETENHVRIVNDVFDQLGLNKEVETPGRNIVRMKGEALIDAMETALAEGDETAAQLVAAECVVEAETKDHANWELIGQVSGKATGEMKSVLSDAYEQVEEEEDMHLYHTMGWARELWIESLGMPAVLPPPEEEKKVTTAIGASRAEQSRDDML